MTLKTAYKDGKPLVLQGKLVQVEMTGAEEVEWHQCPELVRSYLANVTYDPSDYSTSQIANYAPATAVESNYRPIGTEAGAETYYNQTPNVQTPFANSEKAGTLKPLDQVRWIKTTAPNVRDLGGWACDGGTVKYGLLVRGSAVVAADRAALVGECDVRHDLDLRGAPESGHITASPLGTDIYYTCATETNWYALTNAEAWKTNLKCVIDAVTHREPVYCHCTAGADRTATLVCILEGLLGMSQSDIDKDYELTCFYTGTGTDALARRRNEAEWKGLISAINAKTGDSFRDKCVAFAAELGFTAAEINAYRVAMIDGTPETVTIPAVNLLPTAVGHSGTPLNDVGYADGYYLSGNPSVSGNNSYMSADSTHFVTGFVPYTKAQAQAGTPIYVKGVTIDTSNSHERIGAYPSYDYETYIDPVKFSAGAAYVSVEQISDQYYKIVPGASFAGSAFASLSDIQYIRLSLTGSGAGVEITI